MDDPVLSPHDLWNQHSQQGAVSWQCRQEKRLDFDGNLLKEINRPSNSNPGSYIYIKCSLEIGSSVKRFTEIFLLLIFTFKIDESFRITNSLVFIDIKCIAKPQACIVTIVTSKILPFALLKSLHRNECFCSTECSCKETYKQILTKRLFRCKSLI